MMVYIVIGVILLIYLVLVGLLGSFFPDATPRWVFRVLFWIAGIAGAGVFVWTYAKRQRRAKRQQGELSGEDVDLLARDAEARLASARVARDPKLANLPLLLITGETGAAKTSTILHCGAEPQLLAGQVYQDTTVVPTKLANFWYAADTVLAEAGGQLLQDPDAWERLIGRMRRSRLRAAFSGGEQAPRAVLVCIDCETLVQQGQEKMSATARLLRERLGQAAGLLGIDLPVYVLFTKLDRLPAFTDYARNLSGDEAAAILGETLPVRRARSSGVYAEEETKRLTEAFNAIYYELSEKRLMLLAREQQEAKLPGCYEFPREFAKLRSTIVHFLVELCRPSQIDFGPFLRGFYFSGVRPVLVTEKADRATPSIEQASANYGEATRLFGSTGGAGMQAQPSSYGAEQTRKIPQWTFVTRLFNEVLLRDPAAATASSYSRSSHLPKRLMLGAATAILLICIFGFAVSYSNNSAFEERNLAAARVLAAVTPQPGELPSLASLTHLDTLRQSLEEIHLHRIEGRPWSRRWGLYVGEKTYDGLYRAYFTRFRALLLDDAQAGVAADLQGLPAEPRFGVDDAIEQGRIYGELGAHLITTDFHQCSSREAVSRVLLTRWSNSREISEQHAALAAAQFDFYADMLRERNPYEPPSNAIAVEKARRYLSQFEGIERIYLGLVNQASAQVRSVNFNRDFPGTAAVVVNQKDVPGAFTRDGWAFIQPRIASQGASGDSGSCYALIMGSYAASGADMADLGQQLYSRYIQEYRNHWTEYLQATRIVGYNNERDAAAKLERLATAQSPLVNALKLASAHTAGGPPEVAQMFQPPPSVAPAEAETFVTDGGKAYLSDLFTLQAGWDRLAQSPQGARDTPLVESLFAASTAAKTKTNAMALGFGGDPQVIAATGNVLLAPIENSERLLQRLGPLDLNKQGQGLCAQISLLKRKYPFDPNAAQEATLQEVAAVFHPQQGALWALYAGHLQELLVQQGSRYSPRPGGSIQVSQQFVDFFNQAAAISRAFYPEGATEPSFVYTVAPLPIDTFNRLRLRVDGQDLESGQTAGNPQQIQWPNQSSGVVLDGAVGGGAGRLTVLTYPPGPWAVFRFFSEATLVPESGSGVYEWRPQTSGQPMMVNGRPVVFRYRLDHGANPPILKKGYLSTLSCPSTVTR